MRRLLPHRASPQLLIAGRKFAQPVTRVAPAMPGDDTIETCNGVLSPPLLLSTMTLAKTGRISVGEADA
ncbi:MAG: hypothetical protein JO323_23720 [Acidobacteriia bacterium]|nr:hypothetical protein [Terriglobia bacterium]